MSLFQGKFLLNPLKESVMIFPIEEGANFEEGDLVVVDTRKIVATLPKKESGYVSVGRVVDVIITESGKSLVICKDGIYMCKNTDNYLHKITANKCGDYCYFESEDTVTLDNINTTIAGKILQVTGDSVIIQIKYNKEEY